MLMVRQGRLKGMMEDAPTPIPSLPLSLQVLPHSLLGLLSSPILLSLSHLFPAIHFAAPFLGAEKCMQVFFYITGTL